MDGQIRSEMHTFYKNIVEHLRDYDAKQEQRHKNVVAKLDRLNRRQKTIRARLSSIEGYQRTIRARIYAMENHIGCASVEDSSSASQ